MKKLLIAGLSAALVVGFSACSNQSTSSGGSSGGGRVALVAKANSAEYWVKVKEGAEAAGKELGVDVSFNGPTPSLRATSSSTSCRAPSTTSRWALGSRPRTAPRTALRR